MRIWVMRAWRTIDQSTSEVKCSKRYAIGYSTDGRFLSLNDGRRPAADITRPLGDAPAWSLETFELQA